MLISKRVLDIDDIRSAAESDSIPPTMATSQIEHPASKLITDEVSDAAIAWGTRQSQTAIQAHFTPALLPARLDYVTVQGINRNATTADIVTLKPNLARLIIDTYGLDVHNPVVIPAGFSTSNLTGTYDTLNQILNPPEIELTEGYNPPALLTINHAVNTVVNLSFNNQAARPLIGTQSLYVHARDSVNPTNRPSISVVLRQGGIDIATLTLLEVERTYTISGGIETLFGAIHEYEFDAAILPSSTAPIELRITGNTNGTRAADFLAVTLRSQVEGTLYDTGWQLIGNETASGKASGSDRVTWAPRIDLPTPIDHYVIVEFSDYGLKWSIPPLPIEYLVVRHQPITEPFKAGRFMAGSGIELALREQGLKLQRSGNNINQLTVSKGGTLRSSRVDQMRWDIGLSIVPQTQQRLFGELETFLQSIGATIPALYVLADSTTPPDAQVPAFYALLTAWEPSDIGLYRGDDGNGGMVIDKFFDITLAITEHNSAPSARRE